MNTNLLLGIGWPEQATTSVPYGLASALALFLTVWLLAFLKRTADEHYRLLKEKKREDADADAADEEDVDRSVTSAPPNLEKPLKWLYVAGRADILDETVPSSSAGSASPLFFPATRVRSLTATLDFRPTDHMSARLECRHDAASSPMYFKNSETSPSAKSQSTLTFGITAWF